MRLIAGVDPALDVTGVALYRPEDGLYKSYTVVGVGKGPARNVGIRNQLLELVKGVELVAIEDYFFSEKFAAASGLGELHGVLRAGMYDADIKFVVVPPVWLKRYATNDNRATKDEIRLAVYKRWGVECKTHDEVDAFVLSKIGAAVAGYRKSMTGYQKEVIGKLLNFQR